MDKSEGYKKFLLILLANYLYPHFKIFSMFKLHYVRQLTYTKIFKIIAIGSHIYLSHCYRIAWNRVKNHLRLSVILSVCL